MRRGPRQPSRPPPTGGLDLLHLEHWRPSLGLVILLLTVEVVISRTIMGLMRANRRRTRAGAVTDDEVIILG